MQSEPSTNSQQTASNGPVDDYLSTYEGEEVYDDADGSECSENYDDASSSSDDVNTNEVQSKYTPEAAKQRLDALPAQVRKSLEMVDEKLVFQWLIDSINQKCARVESEYRQLQENKEFDDLYEKQCVLFFHKHFLDSCLKFQHRYYRDTPIRGVPGDLQDYYLNTNCLDILQNIIDVAQHQGFISRQRYRDLREQDSQDQNLINDASSCSRHDAKRYHSYVRLYKDICGIPRRRLTNDGESRRDNRRNQEHGNGNSRGNHRNQNDNRQDSRNSDRQFRQRGNRGSYRGGDYRNNDRTGHFDNDHHHNGNVNGNRQFNRGGGYSSNGHQNNVTNNGFRGNTRGNNRGTYNTRPNIINDRNDRSTPTNDGYQRPDANNYDQRRPHNNYNQRRTDDQRHPNHNSGFGDDQRRSNYNSGDYQSNANFPTLHSSTASSHHRIRK